MDEWIYFCNLLWLFYLIRCFQFNFLYKLVANILSPLLCWSGFHNVLCKFSYKPGEGYVTLCVTSNPFLLNKHVLNQQKIIQHNFSIYWKPLKFTHQCNNFINGITSKKLCKAFFLLHSYTYFFIFFLFQCIYYILINIVLVFLPLRVQVFERYFIPIQQLAKFSYGFTNQSRVHVNYGLDCTLLHWNYPILSAHTSLFNRHSSVFKFYGLPDFSYLG